MMRSNEYNVTTRAIGMVLTTRQVRVEKYKATRTKFEFEDRYEIPVKLKEVNKSGLLMIANPKPYPHI